ncbi:hypothetical protein XELAEV_18029953mg [Xenopus laevis]|uniref:Uncharacterized protein n=1 Tax=Xenopus laevis TaxID=8355 RepID=A0A974CSM6_XENLA|nr:hypothetical protein XELAEV_18029953mg [Xenopus laevis]
MINLSLLRTIQCHTLTSQTNSLYLFYDCRVALLWFDHSLLCLVKLKDYCAHFDVFPFLCFILKTFSELTDL